MRGHTAIKQGCQALANVMGTRWAACCCAQMPGAAVSPKEILLHVSSTVARGLVRDLLVMS